MKFDAGEVVEARTKEVTYLRDKRVYVKNPRPQALRMAMRQAPVAAGAGARHRGASPAGRLRFCVAAYRCRRQRQKGVAVIAEYSGVLPLASVQY